MRATIFVNFDFQRLRITPDFSNIFRIVHTKQSRGFELRPAVKI